MVHERQLIASLRLAALAAMIIASAVDVMAQSVDGTNRQPTGRTLQSTYWKAVEIAGKPIPAQPGTREAHLVFQADGRISGSDGCNRMSGSYEVEEDRIAFGQTLSTRMACPGTGEVEQGFRAALKDASRWRITADRLELFDAGGVRLAAFEGRALTP
jgi:heat shock protein HslJ